MFKDKLKEMFAKKENGNSKRKIENLVFLIIVLIITIVAINYIWDGNKTKENANEILNGKRLAQNKTNKNLKVQKDDSNSVADNQNNNQANYNEESNNLEKRLKNILSKICGIEDVEVLINYSESSESVAMYNENSKSSTTEETDKSGTTRKVEETDSQKEVVYQEEDGIKTPIIQKTIEPKIEGAIITTKSANNIDVKTNIIQAVEAVTGLPAHKICVLVGN